MSQASGAPRPRSGEPGTEGDDLWFEAATDYVVSAEDPAAPSVSFSVGRREMGLSLDRIALVGEGSGIDIRALDALPNSPRVS